MPDSDIDIMILLRNKRIRIHQKNEEELSRLAQEVLEELKKPVDNITRKELKHFFEELNIEREGEINAFGKLNKKSRLRRVR